ncbi:MAG: hypothetical protein QG591_1616 [Planctomycetota bacterium]|nr:hypothetical protein [Planctomycetota bacterium]
MNMGKIRTLPNYLTMFFLALLKSLFYKGLLFLTGSDMKGGEKKIRTKIFSASMVNVHYWHLFFTVSLHQWRL